MEVGDYVKTVDAWNEKYKKDGLRGVILEMAEYGPIHPDRRIRVQLDEKYREFERLWFAPADLEPGDG